jgi:hypothetical protein
LSCRKSSRPGENSSSSGIRLHGNGDHVLPLARLGVGVGPGQSEHVGQEPFGESVAPDDLFGERSSGLGECDAVTDGEESVGLEPSDHLRDRRAGDLEPLGDPGLDHGDVVLVEFPDRLAVLLCCGVELASSRSVGGHGCSLRSRA